MVKPTHLWPVHRQRNFLCSFRACGVEMGTVSGYAPASYHTKNSARRLLDQLFRQCDCIFDGKLSMLLGFYTTTNCLSSFTTYRW